MGMEARDKRRPGGWTQADWRMAQCCCRGSWTQNWRGEGAGDLEGKDQATCRGEGGGDLGRAQADI
ncbi:hypothetical protein BRADI_5g14325v3 [Brachypodium distachyon]|uniref:Uncharacterized protein n=1 Tax=Brachypodium distachyon TaxID=15368 RepID=A0A2K2CH48_BRADI|nr:hypothetical protein BRADI_5g14325v3 [Brachypodium distachyon]